MSDDNKYHPLNNGKINRRWQRRNQTRHVSSAERLRQKATQRLIKTMNAKVDDKRVEFPSMQESWDLSDKPSRSFYTFITPGMRASEESINRVREFIEKTMGDETLDIFNSVWGVDTTTETEPTTEVLINGRWVPTEEI